MLAYTPTPQTIFMAWCLVKHGDNCTFNVVCYMFWYACLSSPLIFSCTYHCRRHHHHHHSSLQGLGLMACSNSEFNFAEFMNLWTFGRTSWTGNQPNARPLPTHDNTTQKNVDTHPCLEWDSNLQSQCLNG